MTKYNKANTKNAQNECKNPWLCSALGFFVPVLGLIIGAIIGKGTGVKHALGGIVLRYVLGVMLLCWFYSVGKKIEQSEQARQPLRQEHAAAGWSFEREQSSIDDSTTYTLSRASVEVVGKYKKAPAELIIRRQEGKNEVFITWPSHLAVRKVPVTVRFDKDEAVTEDWGCSTDGKAAFSPFPFADFWGMVKDSRHLTVRLIPYGENPQTVTFDLSNIPVDALKVFNR